MIDIEGPYALVAGFLSLILLATGAYALGGGDIPFKDKFIPPVYYDYNDTTTSISDDEPTTTIHELDEEYKSRTWLQGQCEGSGGDWNVVDNPDGTETAYCLCPDDKEFNSYSRSCQYTYDVNGTISTNDTNATDSYDLYLRDTCEASGGTVDESALSFFSFLSAGLGWECVCPDGRELVDPLGACIVSIPRTGFFVQIDGASPVPRSIPSAATLPISNADEAKIIAWASNCFNQEDLNAMEWEFMENPYRFFGLAYPDGPEAKRIWIEVYDGDTVCRT